MNIGTISNPCLKVKPSKKLYSYIKHNVSVTSNMPPAISNIVFKNQTNDNNNTKVNIKYENPHYLLTDEDRAFINKLDLSENSNSKIDPGPRTDVMSDAKLLTLGDLRWLYEYINEQDDKIYFHTLFEGSEIILPKNDMIPRNEELEKRCQQMRNEFSNKEYHRMIQKIAGGKKFPEDTIAYQMKEMNKQIIAIFQFIISVLAGFAFGFMGIELLIGTLDFGFRLLLGIICALIIALAELYFLAKKLNEDVNVEWEYEHRIKSSKLD